MQYKSFPWHMILTLAGILTGFMADCALGQVGGNAAQAPKPDQTAARADATVAHWRFDGELRDRSGRGHHITAEGARFVPGRSGQAVQFGSEGVLVRSSPDLQLAPGLRIECWVYFERESPGCHAFVMKDREYQLRVDPSLEGGRFAFFVYLDGWEPRVCSREPVKLGVWYHLIAEWDGLEATLEVNGEKTRAQRSGSPRPRDDSLEIGALDGLIDELRIENPMFLTMQKLSAMSAHVPPRGSKGRDHFGEGVGWPDWAGLSGAHATTSGDKLEATLADSDAMIVNPALDLDLTQRRYLSCDISCPTARTAILIFVTDVGCDAISLPVGPEPRTSVVDLDPTPSWRGRLKLLALSVPGAGPHRVQLENLWVSAKPEGKPFLRVQRLVQGGAILCVGREEKIIAVVHCLGSLGTEVRESVARLVLPQGVKCIGSSVRELGTMPTGTTKTVEWTVLADAEASGGAEVQLTAANCAPASKHCTVTFFPPYTPLAANVPATGAVTYYIDSAEGRNTNSGISPADPWKDFTNINGKTLNAGEKLLIKRGSVINQELQVSARGTADNWAEIGAYETGPRPIIRRNWDIQDRCALIRDPDYLRIRSLAVTCAANGLVVFYSQPWHAGLLIEDCIAYHIEGLYRQNSGIPEWRGQPGPQGGVNGGIAVTGASARDITIRDCDIFHTSNGFNVRCGNKRVTLDRIFCHDCYAHNTSPHPVLVGGTLMQNCIFDASGGHASRGTMGIMLANPRGLTIRNCTFRNIPDSGSYDQGGIDFECDGDGCLIDNCTFENNAGAAIEVLGLVSPQTRNVEIRNSRFIKNNWVKKAWGPAEIYICGSKDPVVACSNGTIHNNGYVLVPGVKFFVNEAPTLTWWTLQDNVQYATVEELRKAMPHNNPPVVNAGLDLHSDQATVKLAGVVRDDGRPAGSSLKVRWEILEGPATVTFEKEASPTTMATFATPGDYLLRLVGDDGELWTSDLVAVHVLPQGASVVKAWEFNRQLDKEGWTEADLGTRERKEGPQWYHVSKPVKYVSGGYYIVAIENSTNARLLSADDLGVDISGHKTIKVRFQNHTPATRMRFAFTTAADTAWDEGKSKSFDVTANDNGPREYAVDMSSTPRWTGALKQLRFDLALGGTAVTGTCRIDYIWIGSSKPVTH